MKVSRKEHRVIREALQEWHRKGLLSNQQTQELEEELETTGFDWQSLSYYTFLLAIFSTVIALVLFLADDWLWKLFEDALEAPDWLKSTFFALLSLGFYALARRRKRTKPQQAYSNESLLILGTIGLAVGLGYLAESLTPTLGYRAYPYFLFGTLICGALARWFPSKMLWIFTLIGLCTSYGSLLAHWAEWDTRYQDLSYFFWFALLGLAIIGGSYGMQGHPQWRSFSPITLLMGLLVLFASLWLLSIFGNYGSYSAWWEVPQIQFWPWSLVLLAGSALAMYFGLKTDQSLPRDIGVTFIFINLYTRYVEHGWATLNRALFFTVLAISFWLIGRFAERIWTRWGTIKKAKE